MDKKTVDEIMEKIMKRVKEFEKRMKEEGVDINTLLREIAKIKPNPNKKPTDEEIKKIVDYEIELFKKKESE